MSQRHSLWYNRASLRQFTTHPNPVPAMRLLDIVQRESPSRPWAEGDNIPWHDPAFSARMLAEHLSQEHDLASRRAVTIDRHVAWIHQTILGGQPSRVLDLGCGPGLYSRRLARLGHTCAGIDYSPAAIAYARQQADHEPSCTFVLDDIRHAPFGVGYDLALLIFGEFNVFRPDHIRLILHKIRAALRPGGRLLLEPHTLAAVEQMGRQTASWFSSPGGLFSPAPHLLLMDHAWDERQQTATTRYYEVDAAGAAVTRFAQTMQGYSEDEYRGLLADCGFSSILFYSGLAPDAPVDPALCAILATQAPA